MTYLKTTLIATALTVATGGVAFADGHAEGDKHMHDKVKAEKVMKAKKMSEKDMKSKTWTEGTMHPSKVNDTAGEILQADGEPSIQSDREYVTYDGKQKVHGVNPSAHDDIAKTAIVVPGSNNSLTTVNCPEGTVAMPNMTCMIKGEFDLDSSSTTYRSNSEVAGAVDYDRKSDKEMWSDEEKMKMKMKKSSMTSEKSGSAWYTGSTEYKGTLRPNTVVVDNVSK